jgi:hypothetical protein
MSKTFKVDSSGLPLIEAGEYPTAFTGWELKSTQFGESVQLNFTLQDEKNKGTVVGALMRAKITPNTKLGTFVSALMGKELEIDSEIDLDTFLGTKGTVKVKTVNGKKGDYSIVEEFKKG